MVDVVDGAGGQERARGVICSSVSGCSEYGPVCGREACYARLLVLANSIYTLHLVVFITDGSCVTHLARTLLTAKDLRL